MPDLLPGTTVLGLDTPPTVYAEDSTDITGFTNTTFAAGSPVVGVAFTAPTTGRVKVDWSCRFNPTSNINVQIGAHVRTGGTIGSGTTVQDALSEKMLESPNVTGTPGRVSAGMYYVVDGLTPGATYNAVVAHRMVSAGSGSLFARSICVSPLS